MRTTTRTALVGLVVGLAVVAAPVAEAAPTKSVTMTTARTFDPARVTVTRGTAVVWRNPSGLLSSTHTTTSNTGLWNRTVPPGGSFTRTFRKVGTFRYRCTLHPGMTGVVVVR